MSPNQERGGGPTPETANHPNTNTSHRQATGYSHSRGAGRQCRRNSGGWLFRDGFRRGALDALRLMGRRCHCLHCAAEVEKLVEYYSGGDDYELVS
jgi:hypothetical protein